MTPGPAPKDRASRRRRNTPAAGEWVDLKPLETPVLPELEGDFSPEVRELWEIWRRDPVTSQYSPADVGFRPADDPHLRGKAPQGQRDQATDGRLGADTEGEAEPALAGPI